MQSHALPYSKGGLFHCTAECALFRLIYAYRPHTVVHARQAPPRACRAPRKRADMISPRIVCRQCCHFKPPTSLSESATMQKQSVILQVIASRQLVSLET